MRETKYVSLKIDNKLVNVLYFVMYFMISRYVEVWNEGVLVSRKQLESNDADG